MSVRAAQDASGESRLRAEAGPPRPERLAEIVGAVTRQALADRGARAVALIDDGSPESELAARWLARTLSAEAVIRVSDPPRGLESLLQPDGAGSIDARTRIEALRLAARLVKGALVANPINRTVLLLSGDPPPDSLLPLGDLYASEVMELAGGWSGPEPVRELAERAGGIAQLDAALRGRLEGRDPQGLSVLRDDVRVAVVAALQRGRAGRRTPWVVPKIGTRTLGVDLFE